MKYYFISKHPEYPESKWAKHIGVSRSGYYNWKRTRDMREKREREYADQVRAAFIMVKKPTRYACGAIDSFSVLTEKTSRGRIETARQPF